MRCLTRSLGIFIFLLLPSFSAVYANGPQMDLSADPLKETRASLCWLYLLNGFQDECLETYQVDGHSDQNSFDSASLSEVDRTEITEAFAENIAQLSPHFFNEILLELMTKFERHPAYRKMLKGLCEVIYLKSLHELIEDQERVLIKPIFRDALTVFLLGVVMSGSRGLITGGVWTQLSKARALFHGGVPLRFSRTFKEVLKITFEFISKDKKIILYGTASAAGYGSIDALLAYVHEKKLNAMDLLSIATETSIKTLWQWIVDRNDELSEVEKALSQSELLSTLEAEELFRKTRSRLSKIDQDLLVRDVPEQLQFFSEEFPAEHGKVGYVMMDLHQVRNTISSLEERVTGLELKRASASIGENTQTQGW